MAASLLAESENKFGHWTVEYSSIAEREYYRNKVTKQVVWDMPDEIRFFLPAKLEARLMQVFDYGHIETFKQYVLRSIYILIYCLCSLSSLSLLPLLY